MRWLGSVLGRAEGVPEEWYSLSTLDLGRNEGSPLLRLYNNSPSDILKSLYPEKQWIPWKFHHAPRGLWKDPAVHRQFLDWLATEMKLSKDGLYRLTRVAVISHGGERLLKIYGDVFAMVSTVYDDYHFLPWRFERVPSEFWEKVDNRKAYISWLITTVNVKQADQLRTQHFVEHHGLGLLLKYKSSPSAIISSLQAPSDSIPSSFEEAIPFKKKHFWQSIEKQKQFASHLASVLGFDWRDMERWYRVTPQDFYAHGGGGMLRNYFNSSPYQYIKAVFPDYRWLPWKFNRVPLSVLNDKETIAEALKYVATTLKITEEQDWKRVTEDQLDKLGLRTFVEKQGIIIVVFFQHSRWILHVALLFRWD